MWMPQKISDLFFIHQRGRANAVYFVAVMVGSFLTPMAAGVQAAQSGWRYSYTCLGIAFTVLAALYVVAFEETKYVRKPTVGVVDLAAKDARPRSGEPGKKADADKKDDILEMDQMARTKSNALGEVTPPPNTYRERMRLLTPTGEPWLKLFIAPVYTLALPHVWFTALQFASGVCWLVLMLSTISVIFSAPPYNFSTAGVGYMAVGPFVGNVFGSLYGGQLSDWSIRWLAQRNGGVFEPEMRLYILMPPTLILSAGLIVFGWTAGEVGALATALCTPRPLTNRRQGMHWIYPSIGGAMFAFGLGAYGDIAFTFVIDTYRDVRDPFRRARAVRCSLLTREPLSTACCAGLRRRGLLPQRHLHCDRCCPDTVDSGHGFQVSVRYSRLHLAGHQPAPHPHDFLGQEDQDRVGSEARQACGEICGAPCQRLLRYGRGAHKMVTAGRGCWWDMRSVSTGRIDLTL